jgi:hypothetical protein
VQLSDIFVGLGEDNVAQLLRSISIGKLKTFQLYERLKARLNANKVNSEVLRKSAPRVFARLQDKDEELATDLGQSILVSHLDLIQATLNFLGIPHEEGFFAKDSDVASYLKDGWQQSVFEKFRGTFPESVLLFYINHLAFEVLKSEEVFVPARENQP